MTQYDFRGLSPTDFEHLTRDLLNADLGLRLQSYAAGRDQGIDLRQVDADGKTIVVQCKHYAESSPSTFLNAVAKEGRRGKTLAVDRYLFVTSRPLTARQQDEIRVKLDSLPLAKSDIWGQDDINAALGRHPEVERRHIKLWISSATALDTLIHSGQWQRSESLLATLAEQARLWVHTTAYDAVLDMLEREGVCIICGPPGVGKTFLAEMALLSASRDGAQIVHVVDNVEAAWDALRSDESPQVFYYDDFLGTTDLELASKSEASSLNSFINRIRRLKSAKQLIMTTREQFINEAGDGHSDQLAALARQPARFSLRMDAYDRNTRAQILFNHLYFSALPPQERNQLAVDNRLLSIVEKPSYNPRLVELGILHAPTLTADDVISTIERALENPITVWQGSFRALSALERQILLTLATLPYQPWPVDQIRELAMPSDALAWTPALHALETTWLVLSGSPTARAISLANPGCRDYLLGVLDDTAVALEQVGRAALVAQFFSLTQSAGLRQPHRHSSAVKRAELASALTSQRDHVLEKLQEATSRDLKKAADPASRLKTLYAAATVLQALGLPGCASWLLDVISDFVGQADSPQARLPVINGLALAEALDELVTDTPAVQHQIALRVAHAAVNNISTTQELDACEALPDALRLTPELQTAIREKAQAVLEFEYGQLLDVISDPDEVQTAARELDQRAEWYGIQLDTGPLLDRADDLRQAESVLSSSSDGEEGDDESGDPAMDLHLVSRN
jgi:hypothetical protein